MEINIQKLRLILWLILACFLVFFLWMGVVPVGKITYSRDFNHENESYFLKKLTPKERIMLSENGTQKIIGELAYFFLYTPRTFDKAKMIIKYKSESPIIEAGVLMDKKYWNYNLRPVENKFIDKLMAEWDSVRKDNLILLQREKKLDSVDQFLENFPNLNKVALYNHQLNQDFLLADYASSSEKNVLNFSFRGNYRFYTYIKDEDLDFSFKFFDINKDKEADPIDVNLYYNNELIDNLHLEDDGIETDIGETTEDRLLEMKSVGLPEGVYKIEVKVSDDIVTEKIETRQKKLAFMNKIWIYKADSATPNADHANKFNENGGENFSVFTDAKDLRAQTTNPASVQKIKIGDKILDVKETYKQFGVLLKEKESEVVIEKSDIMIAGNGVFSFSKEAMLNPSIKKVDSSFSSEGIDYILAEYTGPKESDGWKMAEIELGLKGAYREDGEYSFMITGSGLSEEKPLELDRISIELEGRSLWEKIGEILK